MSEPFSYGSKAIPDADDHDFEKRFLQTEQNLMLPIAESAMKGKRPLVFVTTPLPSYMKNYRNGPLSTMAVNSEVLKGCKNS